MRLCVIFIMLLARVSRAAFARLPAARARAPLPRHATSRAPLARLAIPAGNSPHSSIASSDSSSKLRAFVQRVKRETTLSEVIADSNVRVVQKGNGHMAHCPFHKDGKEQNPSMKIDDQKGFYYCFTCKAHGDAIKFVEETEDLT